MRTDLDHLSADKQRELERVVRMIFEEFEDALALAKHQWKKRGRIEKIILYGSYARGEFRDEPTSRQGYQSDFDILIIVNDKRLTSRVDYWLKLQDRLIRELTITHSLRTPVNFIVHTLQEVNDGLAHGRYFFMDVRQDGIALYQIDDSELHTPKPKTPQQAFDMAREYFDVWFPSAMKRFEGAKFYLDKEYLRDAAFDLHQTAERLYHCVLLTVTFYTPHVHNIEALRGRAETLDRRLVEAWPRETKADELLFGKLQEAYVKARYFRHYQITTEQLEWLTSRVEMLGGIVLAICTERLAALEQAVAEKGP
ncbi:MAG: HEPN domain-containing protein [Sphingomonas sp.]|jgi:predicted nucleotidyltransferase/HEPN domain-containing protein|uniref:HEPN domain-containing protein n=2 Tax=Alphaproteobacteria TaxID=28211 RepID=UPI00356280A2